MRQLEVAKKTREKKKMKKHRDNFGMNNQIETYPRFVVVRLWTFVTITFVTICIVSMTCQWKRNDDGEDPDTDRALFCLEEWLESKSTPVQMSKHLIYYLASLSCRRLLWSFEESSKHKSNIRGKRRVLRSAQLGLPFIGTLCNFRVYIRIGKKARFSFTEILERSERSSKKKVKNCENFAFRYLAENCPSGKDTRACRYSSKVTFERVPH